MAVKSSPFPFGSVCVAFGVMSMLCALGLPLLGAPHRLAMVLAWVFFGCAVGALIASCFPAPSRAGRKPGSPAQT